MYNVKCRKKLHFHKKICIFAVEITLWVAKGKWLKAKRFILPLWGNKKGALKSFGGRCKIFARPPQDIAPPAARYSHGRGKLVTCRISPFSPPLLSPVTP